MADVVKDFVFGMPIGMYIILILAFGLLLASWWVPPLGVISASSLKGTSLFLASSWLFYTTCNIPTILASGAKIRAEYKGAKIEIGRHRKNNEVKEKEDGFEDVIERDKQDGDNPEGD